MAKKKSGKGGSAAGNKVKYAAELARIKEMRTLDSILKRGDVENALLTNSAKEQEPVSENVIDSILDSVNKGSTGEKDLEMIEKLTAGVPESKGARRKSARKEKKAKRIFRIFKHKKAKPKRRRR